MVGEVGTYASTPGLTVTNPMTILSFAAIFAGFGVAAGDGGGRRAPFIAGVFPRSAFSWPVLSLVVDLVRTRLSPVCSRTGR